MRSLIFILSAFVWVVKGTSLVYIDRHTLEFNEKISNWSTSYVRVENGSSMLNFTFTTFKTVKKMLIYLTLKVAEDSNDKEFRRVFVRTVIDLGRFLDGSQANPILRNVIKKLQQSMDFQAKFPIPPVSFKKIFSSWLIWNFHQRTYRVINVSFETKRLPIDTKGCVDFRIMGKLSGSSKMHFLSHFAYYGGFLRILSKNDVSNKF